MRNVFIGIGLIVLCVAAFAAAGVLMGDTSHASTRANIVTFADPAGDPSGGAADITTVQAQNDDAGLVTIRITLANRPQLQVGDRMSVFLDTDRDDRSGQMGADYFFALSKTATSTTFGADLCRWNGSAVDCSAPRTTFRATFTPSLQQVAFSANRSELGNTNGIGFSIRTWFGFANNTQTDRAPDVGQPEYILPLVISPVTTTVSTTTTTTTTTTTVTLPPAPRGPTLGPVALVPRRPRAGGTLAATVRVRSRATGGAAPIGSLSCRGKIGKAAAPLARKRTVRGSATCTWRLARSARGKRFTGTIGITAAGGAATRSFAVPIR